MGAHYWIGVVQADHVRTGVDEGFAQVGHGPAFVDEAGARGIAVKVDHLLPDEVGALVARIEAEQGALHVLVNDIWGATTMEWDKSVWESSLEIGLRTLRLGVDTHAITSHFALPLHIKTPGDGGVAHSGLAAVRGDA